jgi:hypothetical protein
LYNENLWQKHDQDHWLVSAHSWVVWPAFGDCFEYIQQQASVSSSLDVEFQSNWLDEVDGWSLQWFSGDNLHLENLFLVS